MRMKKRHSVGTGPISILVGCSVTFQLLCKMGVRNVVHDPQAYDAMQWPAKGHRLAKSKKRIKKKTNRDDMSDSEYV